MLPIALIQESTKMMLRISNTLIFLAILLMANMALALTIANPSALIPRGVANQIDLRFQLRAITLSDLQVIGANDFSTNAIQDLIIAQLDICIDPEAAICRGESNLKAEYQGQRDMDRTPEDDFDNLNVITFPPEGISLQRDPTTTEQVRYTADIHLLIRPLTNAQTYNSDTKIYLSYPTTAQDIVVGVSLSSIVTTQPSGLAVKAGNQSLSVTWEPLGQVDFAQGPQGPAVGMRVYLVETVENRDTYDFLDVMVGYETDPNNENTRYSCTLSILNRETGQCTFSCDADRVAYLSRTLVEANAPDVNVTIQEASRTASSAQFTGLTDTETKYAAFLQALPDGARAPGNTSCAMGSSILTFSYAQITGGDEPKLTDPNCFIATAAYGSPLHLHLDELRWFRDQVLYKLPFGAAFVEIYYTVSPPLAEWIESRPLAAKIVRSVLFVPVHLINWSRNSDLPILGLLLMTLLGLSSSYFFIRRKSEMSL